MKFPFGHLRRVRRPFSEYWDMWNDWASEHDFNDFEFMEKVLKKYLAKYASDEERWWIEQRLQLTRRCRRRNLS